MAPEIALLSDVWEAVKPYIPPKDRLSVAETIVRYFDEQLYLDVDTDSTSGLTDKVLRTAVVSHFDVIEDEDDDGDVSWEE